MTHRWVGAVALVGTFASTASAGDVDEIESLLSQNVVTTASTEAETASSAPATSVTLTSEDLRVYGIRSIDEAINFLALGVVTTDPLRTPDIGARGVLVPGDNGKHFLLLVNGHAINDPLFGAARFDQGAGIPLDMIDRIEVVVGPGSVLYGSNAMLGVINVITKTAKEYRGGHVLGEYEPGRSGRAGAGAGLTFDLFGAKAELTLSAEYFRRFGPDLEFEEQPPYVSSATGQPVVFRRGGPANGIWGGVVRDAYFTDAPAGMLRFRLGDFELNVMASSYRRGIPYTTGDINVDFDDKESFEIERALRFDIKHEATLSDLVQVTSRAYADGFTTSDA